MKKNKQLIQVKDYTFSQLFKILLIQYFYNLGKKIENNAFKLKDCLFPFLLGCVIYELFWILANFIFG